MPIVNLLELCGWIDAADRTRKKHMDNQAISDARPIPGFPGYEITTDGVVRSLRRQVKSPIISRGYRWLAPRVIRNRSLESGLLTVKLWNDGVGRSAYVDDLVAAAYLGPRPSDASELRHIDGDNSNNCLANLEYHLPDLLQGSRPVPGYLGYFATVCGRIWSTGRLAEKRLPPHFLEPYIDRKGYLKVNPSKDGKSRTTNVHKMVCLAFHGEQPSWATEVRHLDGNPTNNRPDNIQWGTSKENAEDRKRHGTVSMGPQHGEKTKLGRIRVGVTPESIGRALALAHKTPGKYGDAWRKNISLGHRRRLAALKANDG